MDKREIAHQIADSVALIREAHMDAAISPEDSVRFHDHCTPYIIHPIWCAMTLLTETQLPEQLRLDGYLALMWHDVPEDTYANLPDNFNDEVRDLVHGMAFASLAVEREKVWERPETVRLLKLYDKTSNLLDASHLSTQRWNTLVEFTLRLAGDVEANFGELNIVKIARAIAVVKIEM